MFKKIDNKYRPIPFWSWNEKLDAEETKRQVELMRDAGIGGFFMHARGGLQTEYMGDAWFENISAAVGEAERFGMHPWAYDENGWPSGFGNGKVNGLGIAYQQKYLRYEEGVKETERTICNVGGVHFYYDVNPFYVDTLNDEATKKFIEEVYAPYYERYGNRIDGFFTDEPQISRNGIPWSFLMPEEYKKRYGEDLFPRLIELYKPVGSYKETRLKFWKMVTEMFSENFMKLIYDWCDEHNLKFTGHMVLEEDFESQLITNGACMPHYAYLHMPGMDWLGRDVYKCLTPMQVSSVAHQLGKKQILSETFALCGHNVGHDALKAIYEWQMVNGITTLCQHLEGYSLRGIRKRDYPPAMYYQQPWWADYKVFNDSMSRIGMILAEGEVRYDTLLLHPQSSAWVCFDHDKNEGLEELNQQFLDVIDILKQKHILFHLGDEIIMERHARVAGDRLIIGTQSYKTVVMPPHLVLFENTKRLLNEFVSNGGTVVTAEEIENNPIISSPYISHTKRIFDDFDVYYFVNETDSAHKTEFLVGAQLMDIKTGELTPFCREYTFMPHESIVVIDNGEAGCEKTEEPILTSLDLSGEWEITNLSPNSLTLDQCDYYFDGELIEKDGYVLNIQNRACSLKRPVNIKCVYRVDVQYITEEMYLVCETPEIFTIEINGVQIDKTLCGEFVDNSFKKINIAKYLRLGENEIYLSVLFKQSEKVYENLEKAKIFESEKNKLTYDIEIEPIYIIGDFSVKCDGEFEELSRKACRFYGKFSIDKPKNKIMLSNIHKQGFPFFAGSMTVSKTFRLDNTNYKFDFSKYGVNVVKVRINESEWNTIMWEPYALKLSNLLAVGENRVEIMLINNLRNLMGPHHLEIGESYFVGPNSFYKEKCVWTGDELEEWNNGYCFAEFGLKNK